MGLGQGEGGNGLAPGHGRQVAGLLLVGAAEGDGKAAQSLHDEVRVGLRRDPGQFLADDAQVHHPEAEAAVVLGHGVAQQLRLCEDGHQPPVHHRRLVSLPGDGRDAFLGQPPCAVLQCLLLGRKREVHWALLLQPVVTDMRAYVTIAMDWSCACRIVDMQKFDRTKFKELILLIARECEDHNYFGATKLNKILFFCDFKAFAELGSPITGAEYVALEHGPVPRHFVPVRDELRKIGDISMDNRGNQQRIVARRSARWELFSPAEQFVIHQVIRELEDEDADSVSELSHKFLGWQAARAEQLSTGKSPTIPYQSVLVSNRRPTASEISEFTAVAKEHGWSPI